MKTKRQSNDKLFSPAPFFMIRTPSLPIDEFFKLAEGIDDTAAVHSKYCSDETFREAIAVASPSLQMAVQQLEKKKGKEKEQIHSSLLKYFLRMSTRSTPFGLFSSVSQGTWGPSTSILFEQNMMIKRARPDMEWLTKVIDKICTEPTVRKAIPIRANPLLFQKGNRIILNHIRTKDDDQKQKRISIHSTPLVQVILDCANQSVSLEQMTDLIMEQMPSLERHKVEQVIQKLLEQDILLFDLHPSLLTLSPLDDLIGKLSKRTLERSVEMNQQLDQLQTIQRDIARYNALPVGQGEMALIQIADQMKHLASSNHFLQVDSAYQGAGSTLNSEIANELTEAVDILYRLSFRKQQKLKSYHARFLETYGTARKVPLLELLGEEGLGCPEIYLNRPQQVAAPSPKEIEWNKWLKRRWCKCLHERKQEIVLTKEVIDKIADSEPEKEKAPLSFDIYCEIIAESSRHIDNGDFLLSLFYNSTQGGSTFGRFIDILGKKTEDSLRAFYQEEEKLEENALFAESSYLPFPSRYANVATYPNLRSYAIDFEMNSLKNSIPLKDILVGVFEDRFYLTLQGRGEELIVSTGNVLNPLYAPIPLRFLRDVSQSRCSGFEMFSLRDLERAPFCPRIRYQKSILSPARWRIDLDQIESSPRHSHDQVEEKLLVWAKTWNLPRYVFLTYGDNRILLDFRKPSHLREVVLLLKKEEEVELVEKIGQEKGEWIKSRRGHHFSEFVIPFLKNHDPEAHPKRPTISIKDHNLPETRWRMPGSEWLFIKCYMHKEQETSFLLHQIPRFAQQLFDQGMIDHWFYIRYSDPLPHLRIRFRKCSKQSLNTLIPLLSEWSLPLLQSNMIHDLSIGCYERELDRYGGEGAIDAAESFFCADTQTSLDLVRAIYLKQFSLPDFAVAAISVIDLLKGFGMDLKAMISFLSQSAVDPSELKGFRSLKNTLISLTSAVLKETPVNSNDHFLIQAFEKRKAALLFYKNTITDLKEKGTITLPVASVQNSLVHMHCNRLMGNNLDLERKACLYALHSINNLAHRL